jgi:uncharacterized protein YbjT (DUF2867 family)
VSVFVIGGTGHTGTHVVRGVRELGFEARAATRKPSRPGEVRFDWSDSATHDFSGSTAMYLISPPSDANPASAMLDILRRARTQGVRRFALLSSSAIPEGAPGIGEVERFLRTEAIGVTLKPSWFMQNFTNPEHVHGRTIREERRLYTSTGNGRLGFIDAADIGEVAARVLTMPEPPNGALVLTGPEALSYADIAKLLGVTLVAIDDEAARQRLIATGMAPSYADLLVRLDGFIRDGGEDRVTDTVERVLGRPPRRFADVVATMPAT